MSSESDALTFSEKEGEKQKQIGQKRRVYFKALYYNLRKLNIKGLEFLEFTPQKIKFSFTPSTIAQLIRKDVVFYCSIRCWMNKFWFIKRDSLPVDLKPKVLAKFIPSQVKDEDLIDVLVAIYKLLVRWSKKYAKWRAEKYKRYLKSRDYLLLDSDDEELFLSNDEKIELYHKKMKILKGMRIPEGHFLSKLRRPIRII